MRKMLGVGVLVVGTGALGWWASHSHAERMQARVTAGAINALGETTHAVQTSVLGRDITVSGIANTQEERAAILERLDSVEGRRLVRDQLSVLPVAAPFGLRAEKSETGTSYRGAIPSEADRSVFAQSIGGAADELILSSGVPDTLWSGDALAALSALQGLETGILTIADRHADLEGVALSPIERDLALAALPEGFTAATKISLLDDGTPFRLEIDVTEEGAVAASGKFPKGFQTTRVEELLQRPLEATDIEQSVLESPGNRWPAIAEAGAGALAALRSGNLQISDAEVRLSGVGTRREIAAAEAALSALPVGLLPIATFEIADDGQPLRLRAQAVAGGYLVEGKLPFGMAAQDVATRLGDASTADLIEAETDDPQGQWRDAAYTGISALQSVQNGELEIVGQRLTLKGTVDVPSRALEIEEALRAGLAEGFEADVALTTLDDGTPPSYLMTYSAAAGVSIDGKLPAGVESTDLAALLDLGNHSGGAQAGLVAGTVPEAELRALAGWLQELDFAEILVAADGLSVNAILAPGVDRDLVISGLGQDMGEGPSIVLTPMSAFPEDGARRQNVVTGLNERFRAGAWQPVFDFAATVESCSREGQRVLDVSKINFLSGEARLDAKSIRAINAIAGLVSHCTSAEALIVEVGGHTDSDGSEEANVRLSEQRAEVVRDALISRGVRGEDVTAQGFGEAKPIADNETEEGRAANRRTELVWSQRPEKAAPAIEEDQEGE